MELAARPLTPALSPDGGEGEETRWRFDTADCFAVFFMLVRHSTPLHIVGASQEQQAAVKRAQLGTAHVASG